MLKRIFTSLSVLSLTYLLVNILHTGIIKFVAEGLGYQAKAGFIKVDLSPKDYTHWNITRVLAIHLLPVILLVILASYILLNINSRQKENSIARFSLFWLMVWFISLTVSLLVISPIGMISPESNPMFQDFSVLALWFRIPVTLMAVLGAVGIGVLILFGFVSANYFFSCASSQRDIRDTGGRRFWLVSMFYIPVVLSIPLSVICTYPDISIAHLVMSASTIFVGLGMNLYSDMRLADRIHVGRDITNRLSLDFFCVLIAIILSIRWFI